jgi:hypothetical protein
VCIDKLNNQFYKGRPVTVEVSQPKGKYEAKLTHIMENTKQTREELLKPRVIKDIEKVQKKVKDEEEKE